MGRFLFLDKRNILFIGGDERQLFCAKYLYRAGYEVSIIGFDKYRDIPEELMVFTNPKIAIILADIIILPTPCTIDEHIFMPYSDFTLNEKDVFSHLDNEKIIFGGKINENFRINLKKKNIKFYDFLEDESITVHNAYITAEGTLQKMMALSDESLFGKNVLIIGFGRISKHLCKLLSALKMNVHVLARKKSDITWAKLSGVKSKQIQAFQSFKGYDFVINTVPVKIFKNTMFDTLHAPFIDLANIGEYHCSYYIKLSALPGKYAPKSAGEITGEYIYQTLAEVEYE